MGQVDKSSYANYLFIKSLEDCVVKLETTETLPKPIDLYYPVVSEDKLLRPWSYRTTGLTVADLRRAVELLKQLAGIEPQTISNNDIEKIQSKDLNIV